MIGLRKSNCVSKRAASSFFKGAKHARDHGRPLNQLVTVNLWQTECLAGEASIRVAMLCAKFTRWLLHQSQKALKQGRPDYGPSTYETVIEAPDGHFHVHWTVHVPSKLQALFVKTLPRWIEKTCGPARSDAVIDVREVETVMALGRYCMKGIDPHQARRYFVEAEDQGVVFGKRVGISRSLGPKARRKEQARRSATGSPSRAGSAADRGHSHASSL